MVVIAAFDLGIKNLSYCVSEFDTSGSLVTVKRWANLNLLADGAESQSQTRCGKCAGPASWLDRSAGTVTGAAAGTVTGAATGTVTLWCKKCVKKGSAGSKPVLELTVKSPKLADWRAWAPAALEITETDAKRLTKTVLEERAAAIRLMPYKAPKAKGVTLQALLAAMETCLNTELTHLAAASRIRLENQPSEFAPHMKSIQIMLFTLIDHRLRTEYGWTGTMEFASAGVKTKGTDAGTGKDAKRSRKLAGIQRVTNILKAAGEAGIPHLTWWSAQVKQDDLADALLMCCDAV
jgi:hypothetical protein